MSATLKDIASASGKDVSTVSRALRGDLRVKTRTAEMIRETAKRMGYQPNLSARNLVAGKTRIIQMILPSLSLPIEQQPAQFAAQYLASKGYDLMITLHHNDQNVYERLLKRLNQSVADGAIIIPGPVCNEHVFAPLIENRTPMVFLDRYPEDLPIPAITSDNKTGAEELTSQCISETTEAVIVRFGNWNPPEKERLSGARKIIEKTGKHFIAAADLNTETDLAENLTILASSQNDIEEFFTLYGHLLSDKKLTIGVFDNWIGEPSPAETVFCCMQDFRKMAETACDLLLDFNKNLPQVNTIPLMETIKKEKRF